MWHGVRICALQGHGVPAWPSSPFGGVVAGTGYAESVSPWDVTDPVARQHREPTMTLGWPWLEGHLVQHQP